MTKDKIPGYTTVGTGPRKVIILHGWWGDHTAYDLMLSWLDGTAFTYVFPDYRGYGLSRDMDGDFSIARIAQDVMALVDHLEWDQFHLLGHSMGGMVVQDVMKRAHGRLVSAIALTPVPACGIPLEGDAVALFHGAAEQDENREGILRFLTSDRLSDGWYRYMVARSRETTTVAAFDGYMRAWTESNFSDTIKGNETPLLVLVGEKDQAITAQAMQDTLLAWFPKAELEIILNAGHFPMNETPARLVRLIEDYFKRGS